MLVAGVLIAVVWVGMSGRSPTPPPVTFNPVAVVEHTPANSPAPLPTPTAQPGADDGPTAVPAPLTPVSGDVFGVSAVLGDAQYITILSEPEPGHLTGRLRLPIPVPAEEGTFVFQQFSSAEVPGQSVSIADWPITVAALSADSSEFYAVNATLPARRTIVGAPRPVERGYRLTVVGQRNGNEGELVINVRIGPNRQLQGNDGILGWAVVAQLEPIAFVPRERGRYNYCRWDVGAMAAPPRPGTDEADC